MLCASPILVSYTAKFFQDARAVGEPCSCYAKIHCSMLSCRNKRQTCLGTIGGGMCEHDGDLAILRQYNNVDELLHAIPALLRPMPLRCLGLSNSSR